MAKEEGFGARLKAARSKAGLTQKELARRAGYDQVSLSRVENGDIVPRFDTVMKIAKVLGLDAAALYQLAAEEPSGRQLAPAPIDASEPAEATMPPVAQGAGTAELWRTIALLQQSVSAISTATLQRTDLAADFERQLRSFESRLEQCETALESKKPPSRRAAGK